MTLGQRIAQKRKELGLSQEALGEQLSVSRQSIYKWEADSSLPEIDKLIAFKQGEDEITEKDVELMVAKTIDYQVYQMVAFIAEKKYTQAYKVIQDLTTISEKQLLFVSIYYHFRRMFFVSISTESDKELAQMIGVKEYAIVKARQQASSFSAKRLRKILNKLSQLDGDYKSGKLLFDNAFLSAMFTVLTEN